MEKRSVLRVVAIALIGLAAVGQPDASADKVGIEELHGTGFRIPSVIAKQEILSDCGDSDPTTNVVLIRTEGTVTYTGVMEGTGRVSTTAISNACVPGHTHFGIRVLDTFESLTVDGRTGGAVVEILGSGRVPEMGIQLNDNTVRILCGTGQLKRIHAEGTLTASIRAAARIDSRPFQVWFHFGHKHDTGFDFLCRDLDSDQ